MYINVHERDLLDGQIQELIKEVASTYFENDVEEAVAYIALMSECVEYGFEEDKQ